MQDGKYVILHIDDDQDCLDTVAAILGSEDFVVAQAGGAEEGLRVFKETNPDLVIVDLMMEEIDAGTQLVRDLRAVGADVPLYMLSGAGDLLDQNIDAAELGLAGVFQKPVDPATLVSTIRARLG